VKNMTDRIPSAEDKTVSGNRHSSHASSKGDPKLAWNWPTSRVRACLAAGQQHELVRFLRERYDERFFNPIRQLRLAPSSEHGFGFATMALCSLLIETMECYRQGLPTSDGSDLKDLREGCNIPPDLEKQLPQCLPGSRKVFISFFERPEHQKFFPDVDGEVFYKKIRCGLLHQAQTKGGWRITRSGKFWDADAHTIDRDEFAARVAECFDALINELKATDFDKGVWPNVRTKLQWLTETS
jgi:hypothetical protein